MAANQRELRHPARFMPVQVKRQEDRVARSVDAAAAGRQLPPPRDPAGPRLGAFTGVLAMYLLFTGLLITLGYGLWPALAGATTACVVAGEVARRVITAGTAPAVGPAGPGPGLGSGLPELLRDVSRLLDHRGGGAAPPGNDRPET